MQRLSLVLWMGLLGFAPWAWAQSEQAPEQSMPPEKVAEAPIFSNNPVLALVEGEAITLNDVMNKPLHDQLTELHNTLQASLLQHVLKKLAQTQPDFQPNFQVAITAQQIEQFYQQNGLEKRGSLDELSPQIKQYLTQQAQMAHALQLYEKASSEGLMQSFLEPPSEFLVTTSLADGMLRANPQAKVMFLEFSDYQCPFCSRSQSTVNELIKKYEGKVAFGYRHFPLAFHKEADEAAIAVECAREQGKFEEMHQRLFANQRQQNLRHLKDYARKIQVNDLKAFDQCLEDEKYRERVEQDLRAGAALGINGTPAFVIGTYDPTTKMVRGEVLSGALPLNRFETVIQKYLNKS